MTTNHSVRFFDQQFRTQVAARDFALNPFETVALPHLKGRVLDYGCGLGNLAVAAARTGCTVQAFDASAAAITHLRETAAAQGLALDAREADLREHRIAGEFDAVVCIGLLMFFDCPTAWRQLAHLQECVRPGGVMVLNVLTSGTTFLDMFDPEGHCLFDPAALRECFAGWSLLHDEAQTFPAPGNTLKAFLTLIARKPLAA